MASTNRVFVSPGVYTSEKDISFVTKQIGVTTLGLVGETTKGPAFQPIFVKDYNEFKSFFGGQNATKVKGTDILQYELPYIAKSYFTKSNQMFITRVLGLSGYDAGVSWAITNENNEVLVSLRSRGSYDASETMVWNVSGATDLNITTTGGTIPLKSDFEIEAIIEGNTGNTISYTVSLDNTKKNFITRVLGAEATIGSAAIFVEEVYTHLINDGLTNLNGAFSAVTTSLASEIIFDNYKEEYKSATSPYVVSEIVGSEIFKLFKFITISDGDAANSEIKISIANIRPDDREFDVYIRAFNDSDANPVFLEKYTKCTMNPLSDNFIGRKIGTLDGYFASKSNYVLVEMDDTEDTSDSFPAGFTGVPARVYAGGSLAPDATYLAAYPAFSKVKKIYLGLSDTIGIDQDLFDYKGYEDPSGNVISGRTYGFHMDSGATSSMLSGYDFVAGSSSFENDDELDGTDYEKLYSRKFTFAPYGGFDGWDVYRDARTNTDNWIKGGSDDVLANGVDRVIDDRTLSNGELGTTSDYYAFVEAIRTFDNPEATNINVLATPGIDITNNSNLVEETIEMVEEDRCDSIYIATLPDTDYATGEVLTAEEIVSELEDAGVDSSYTATYWPWIQINDTENNQLVYLPPTIDVCRNIALTDNVSFPWFAVAGVQRGDVQAIKARKKLTLDERDILYEGRINPIATFATEGVKIWGNNTLQVRESALSKINVRRLLLQARKLISAVSIRLLFEQNDEIVRNQFKSLVNPILENIRSERGLTDFRVDVDNSPESIDRNELNGTIWIKPTRALETINVEFVITNTGASFEDV